LDLAPNSLRDQALIKRLRARDLGDVVPPNRYLDLERPERRCRNGVDVDAYSRALAERVADAAAGGDFVLLLGGDCSILLGALLGLRRLLGEAVGLVYIDAHADFATLEESPSHSPCSMNLALATGRADEPLAHLAGEIPLVAAERVVHLGRRDDHQPAYGWGALASNGVLDLSKTTVRRRGIAASVELALARVGQLADGFWIAFDADVLDPLLMPAVDSPITGGFDFDQATELLAPLVHDPGALGLQLSIYDPNLDTRLMGAARLADMLERTFAVG